MLTRLVSRADSKAFQIGTLQLLFTLVVAVAPISGRSVVFRVVDEDEHPLANVSIRLLVTDSQGIRQLERRTDAKGNFQLQVAELLSSAVVLSAEGKAPTEWRVEATPVFSQAFSIKVQAGRRGGGRVVDRFGHPVAGASAFLRTRLGALVPVGVSGADGIWTSAALAPSVSAADIVVYGPQQLQRLESHGDPIQTNLLTILEKPRVLALKIVDPSGRPIEGVRLIGEDETFWTAGNGEVRLPLPAGIGLAFVAERRGYAPVRVSLETQMPRSVMMAPSRGTTLRIHDSRGSHISGVLIRDVDWNGMHLQWTGWADTNGLIVLDVPPAGQIEAEVLHPDFISQRISLALRSDGKPAELVLRKAFVLRGQLHTSETSASPSFEAVEASRTVDGQSIPVPVAFLHQAGSAYTVAFTNSDLPDFVRFAIHGYNPEVIQVPNRAGETGEFTGDLMFRPQQIIRGTLKDTSGAPVPDATLALSAPGQPLVLGNRALATAELPHVSRTDSNGVFQLVKCPVHHLLLAASPAGFARLDTASITNEIRIQLQPWGAIHAAIRRGPFAPSNLRVTILAPADSGFVLAEAIFSREVSGAENADFYGLPYGRFGLWCGSPETGFDIAAQTEVGNGPAISSHLDLGYRRVTGLIDTNNLAVLFARTNVTFPVFLTSPRDSNLRWETSLPPSMVFELLDVPPGSYRIQVHAHDRDPNSSGFVHCWGIAEGDLTIGASNDFSAGVSHLRLRDQAGPH